MQVCCLSSHYCWSFVPPLHWQYWLVSRPIGRQSGPSSRDPINLMASNSVVPGPVSRTGTGGNETEHPKGQTNPAIWCRAGPRLGGTEHLDRITELGETSPLL